MSSSDLKRALKSARECLAAKEYRDALQHCKAALKEDRSCYEAYLFVGKAAFHLNEASQAELAYQKASEINPSAPHAWQVIGDNMPVIRGALCRV